MNMWIMKCLNENLIRRVVLSLWRSAYRPSLFDRSRSCFSFGSGIRPKNSGGLIEGLFPCKFNILKNFKWLELWVKTMKYKYQKEKIVYNGEKFNKQNAQKISCTIHGREEEERLKHIFCKSFCFKYEILYCNGNSTVTRKKIMVFWINSHQAAVF